MKKRLICDNIQLLKNKIYISGNVLREFYRLIERKIVSCKGEICVMKKWKKIRVLTISILCIFALYSIYIAIVCCKRNCTYPYEALGAVEINNWMEAFRLEMMLRLFILGIPLIINIIFLIVSIIKIKKYQ